VLRSLVTSTILKSLFSSVWELSTPKGISFMWGFGRFLGGLIILQISSGLLLAFYYVGGVQAWDSIVEISREVWFGWGFRLIHRNNASFLFVVLFIHFFRGVFYCSYYLVGPWLRGWFIMFLTMAAAFLGYVLPWGQMSFWGATVIINLLRVLPSGKVLVIWLWGGFFVSSFTCRFFYAIHFLVPFIILIIVIGHLLLLHFRGSSVPGGIGASPRLKIKFGHLFLYKDIVNVRGMWIMWLWALAFPDWSADPVNFVVSDLSNSPLHIQPEWYFLHLYAVLRSIPRKLGGLLGFALALFLLTSITIVQSYQRAAQLLFLNYFSAGFILVNFILMWLGSQPVEPPYIFIGQILTVLYFSFIIYVLTLDSYLLVFFLWRALWTANS